jgi:ABC-type maltose transport system permease subunit
MFIGILTARYVEEDFLKSLPNKMIIGLFTLIFSIATMMTTFCASLFIILPEKSRMLIPLICLAGVPVVIFAWMQFGLSVQINQTKSKKKKKKHTTFQLLKKNGTNGRANGLLD